MNIGMNVAIYINAKQRSLKKGSFPVPRFDEIPRGSV